MAPPPKKSNEGSDSESAEELQPLLSAAASSSNAVSTVSFADLPDELIFEICFRGHLDPEAVCRLALVSRKLYQVIAGNLKGILRVLDPKLFGSKLQSVDPENIPLFFLLLVLNKKFRRFREMKVFGDANAATEQRKEVVRSEQVWDEQSKQQVRRYSDGDFERSYEEILTREYTSVLIRLSERGNIPSLEALLSMRGSFWRITSAGYRHPQYKPLEPKTLEYADPTLEEALNIIARKALAQPDPSLCLRELCFLISQLKLGSVDLHEAGTRASIGVTEFDAYQHELLGRSSVAHRILSCIPIVNLVFCLVRRTPCYARAREKNAELPRPKVDGNAASFFWRLADLFGIYKLFVRNTPLDQHEQGFLSRVLEAIRDDGGSLLFFCFRKSLSDIAFIRENFFAFLLEKLKASRDIAPNSLLGKALAAFYFDGQPGDPQSQNKRNAATYAVQALLEIPRDSFAFDRLQSIAQSAAPYSFPHATLFPPFFAEPDAAAIANSLSC